MSQKNDEITITPEFISEAFLDPNKIFAKDPWATIEVESGRARLLGKIPDDDGFFILERVRP